jgi:hypothetical protein
VLHFTRRLTVSRPPTPTSLFQSVYLLYPARALFLTMSRGLPWILHNQTTGA